MKISCLRTDLANAVANVSRAVSTKATIPALEGVLIKAYGEVINISGYNLEIGIKKEDIPKLFVPFERIEERRKTI